MVCVGHFCVGFGTVAQCLVFGAVGSSALNSRVSESVIDSSGGLSHSVTSSVIRREGYNRGALQAELIAHEATITCPKHAEFIPPFKRTDPSKACVCKTGYFGELKPATKTKWTGTCTLAPCPANAGGAPTCNCNSAYVGTLSFTATGNKGSWDGKCVKCPTDAFQVKIEASKSDRCRCKFGYRGNLTSVMQTGTTKVSSVVGSCEVAPCPENSAKVGGGVHECRCDVGYEGKLMFDFKLTPLAGYNGSCVQSSVDPTPLTAPLPDASPPPDPDTSAI